MAAQYFKIKKSRQEYKGERYFRVNYDSPKVCQVCINAGEMKRGRTPAPGITMIDAVGFWSNYASYYIEPTTKGTFDKKFEIVVRILKAN
jgi:hypothetical protein